MYRRWSSNVSMRQPVWTLTGRWSLCRRPRFSWSPDRRRRLASSPAIFWKHTEGMMANRHTARLRLRNADSPNTKAARDLSARSAAPRAPSRAPARWGDAPSGAPRSHPLTTSAPIRAQRADRREPGDHLRRPVSDASGSVCRQMHPARRLRPGMAGDPRPANRGRLHGIDADNGTRPMARSEAAARGTADRGRAGEPRGRAQHRAQALERTRRLA